MLLSNNTQSIDILLLTHLEPLILSDISVDSRISKQQKMFGTVPIRFYANVPIFSSDGFVLGVIAVADYTPHDLRLQQQEALSILANQIGTLLELRTLPLLANKNRQQALLIELSRRALSGEPIIDIMKWIVRHVSHALEVSCCSILELLPNNEAMLRASVGWGTLYTTNIALPLNHYMLAAATLQSSQPIVIDTLAHARRFGEYEILQTHGIESGISLIIPSDSGPYGLLSVYTEQRRSFTHADIAFLQTVADLLTKLISQQWHQQNLVAIVNLSHMLRRATTRTEMMTLILTYDRSLRP